MGAGAVPVALLVGGRAELRNVAVHRPLRHREADVATAGTAFLRRNQRQVNGVGDEVRLQQQAVLLVLGGEVVRLTGEPPDEVVRGVEHELGLVVEVDHRRHVRRRHEPGRHRAGAVEVLVPGVQRNGEHRARPPLEGDLLAGVVPHRGGPVPGQHQDHLLEQLSLRRQLLACRDLAHVAVVGGPRCFVVDEHAAPAAACPRLQLDGVEIGHIVGADDVEALAADPPHVRRVLLGGELLRQIVGNDCILGHEHPPSHCLT